MAGRDSFVANALWFAESFEAYSGKPVALAIAEQILTLYDVGALVRLVKRIDILPRMSIMTAMTHDDGVNDDDKGRQVLALLKSWNEIAIHKMNKMFCMAPNPQVGRQSLRRNTVELPQKAGRSAKLGWRRELKKFQNLLNIWLAWRIVEHIGMSVKLDDISMGLM